MQLKLSPHFEMPAVDYAGQGNAILGIRDAGKTYTAMKAAEELLLAGIPIIVYDPVGVWKNLKIGTGKNKGFPIVVAGGEGSDIRLNVNNAIEIVRAAMKENVSLVIDLYSPELINKSTWIRIVQETVDLLMYENKTCGLRHIFIEEAAEFIPQRLQPQHSKVYASIERLARMGRNARLGYTLINQRAEEVNKAILEISALSLLHKQVGKNSIASVQKWLELMQVVDVKNIVKSLPTLGQGECWAIGMAGQPQRIKIAERRTFHPDPKKEQNPLLINKAKADVSLFVEKLNKVLKKPEPAGKPVEKTTEGAAVLKLLEQLRQVDAQLAEKENSLVILTQKLEDISRIIADRPMVTAAKVAAMPQPIKTPVKTTPAPPATGSLGKCPGEILKFLASFPERLFSKAQVGIATGYSPNSGGFNNALSELNSKNLIVRLQGKLQVNQQENYQAFLPPAFAPQQYSIDAFKTNLSKCEAEIYEVLLNNKRREFIKEDLAAQTATGYAFNSGGFNNALSRLNTLELISRNNRLIRLNPELLELVPS